METHIDNRYRMSPQVDKFILDIPPFDKNENREAMMKSLQSLKPVGRAVLRDIESAAKSIRDVSTSRSLSMKCVLSESDIYGYKRALEDAQLCDIKFGLCSQESKEAWFRVDNLYNPNAKIMESMNNDMRIEALEDIIKSCKRLNRALDEYDKLSNHDQ
eukprot:CAMPEP_0172487684 /NCGR_PEP_ID=MMETSP1066-20121228/16860_1 /TAXON_ID=671091 /ORGANISM="Coscinodiscus wailesii, Strain CCMP2513" /LENGTH=158 /DNA_ID=CAMNT_0013254443 /DNA_START=84 /DNA_END=560 /DNA_ORIENTATION=+